MIEMTHHFHHVSFILVYLHTDAFWSIQKQIVENDMERKYPEEYSTVDKVGIGKTFSEDILSRVELIAS